MNVRERKFHYLALLHGKVGELRALSELSADVASITQPLVRLDKSRSDHSKQLDELIPIIRTLARNDRLLMVDASDLPHQDSAIPGGAFEYLSESLEHAVVQPELGDPAIFPFIPVVRTTDVGTWTSHVGAIGRTCGRGVTLRLIADEYGGRNSVDRAVTDLDVSCDQIDLIVDEQYLDPARSIDRAVDDAQALLSRVKPYAQWRSVTLAGGSIPKTRLRTNARVVVERYEYQFWRQVCTGLRSSIIYGDHGVVHPLQQDGQAFRSPHPYLWYTGNNGWDYYYGNPNKYLRDSASPSARAFLDLTDRIVSSECYCGAQFSWGDHEIHECAERKRSKVGSVTSWIAFGTSHHLAYVARQQLDQALASS